MPEISNDLSALVGTFLQQVSSVVNGMPLPISPQLAGWSTIRLRHEGGKLGDFTRCTLQAMLVGDEEMRAFAEYCCKVANGDPPAPVPNFSQHDLAAAAKEVRNLADPQIGGFRLLLSRAPLQNVEQVDTQRPMSAGSPS